MRELMAESADAGYLPIISQFIGASISVDLCAVDLQSFFLSSSKVLIKGHIKLSLEES